MNRLISILLLALLILNSSLHAQQPVTRSQAYWLAYAGKLPIGSTVNVRTIDGKRQTGVLAIVEENGITIEPKTRIPEQPRRIPFDQLTQLELRQQTGSSVARSIAIGAGIGAGAFLGLLMVLAASWD